MDEREQNQQSTSGRSRQDTTHRQRRHPRKEGRLPIGFIIKTLLLIFICTGVIFYRDLCGLYRDLYHSERPCGCFRDLHVPKLRDFL